MQKDNLIHRVKNYVYNMEENGNYSFVCLAKNAIPVEKSYEWLNYLKKQEFYRGQTSFGEIPRLQRFVCDKGEYFGK